MLEPLATQYGWICPRCGVVNNPAVLQCPCNGGGYTTYPGTIPQPSSPFPGTGDPITSNPIVTYTNEQKQ